MHQPNQLISYIAPGAPATRRPAHGNEAFLRPEIGFTPAWYRQALSIDFGERFHTNPAYRRECVLKMRAELKRRFPETRIGGIEKADGPLDLLTGTYGGCTVAAIYGVRVLYDEDHWPDTARDFLTDEEVARLEPPNLDRNPHFQNLMDQVEWIEEKEDEVHGFINWQGVLNNAHRLRGEKLLLDVIEEPERARHLFACVCETMIQGVRRLHERQRAGGVEVDFVTVSNCLVNLVSPRTYQELLLPFDQQIADMYASIGIHNCAWDATPYLESYAGVRGVSYIDMGLPSNLTQAKALFPQARRALMYTPMDAVNKAMAAIEGDFRRVARTYAPCDMVIADLDAHTPDTRVEELIELCQRLSEECES